MRKKLNLQLTAVALFCAVEIFSVIGHCTTYSVVPSDLKNSELGSVIDVLGYSTCTKYLSNPYPLGGFSGVEVGIETELIDISGLSQYGAGDVTQSSFQYTKISVGKGLFNNVDAFLQFVPFSSGSTIEAYGASLKWTFYEASYVPLTVSFIGSYDSSNIQDIYITEHYSGDVMFGFNVKHFAIYFGGGTISGRHSFSINTLDMSDAANVAAVNSDNFIVMTGTQGHSFLGAHYEISNIFLAAEVDRYENSVYSAKLGARF
jgi:hypothetical protein